MADQIPKLLNQSPELIKPFCEFIRDEDNNDDEDEDNNDDEDEDKSIRYLGLIDFIWGSWAVSKSFLKKLKATVFGGLSILMSTAILHRAAGFSSL